MARRVLTFHVPIYVQTDDEDMARMEKRLREEITKLLLPSPEFGVSTLALTMTSRTVKTMPKWLKRYMQQRDKEIEKDA